VKVVGGLLMQVHYIVAHELRKEQHATGAELTLSDKVMPNDDKTKSLLTELNKRFQSHNSVNAMFGNQQDPFPSAFNRFNLSRSESEFLSFTKHASEDLRSKILSSAPAKGGYLVFADYESHGSFTAVFLIRNKSGMLFIRKNNRFVVDAEIQHIDFENLAMACRINCDILNNPDNQDRYLRFTKKDSEEISAYFRQWVTMNNTESMRDNTKNLYKALVAIPRPTDPEGNEISVDDLMRKAVSHIKDKKKEVNLRQLSLYLYCDENVIHDYAMENNIILDSEFRAEETLLNRYLNVRVKADRFDLRFPREYMDDKIQVLDDNPDIRKNTEENGI